MKYKKGASIPLFLDDFTDEEWQAIYPFDEISCVAQIERAATEVEYFFTHEVDEVNRIISFEANTINWPVAKYRADIRVKNNGRNTFIPADKYIRFEVIESIADDKSGVA